MESNNSPLKFSKKQRKLLTAVETGTLSQVQKLILQCRNLKKHESFGYMLLVTALHRKHKSLSKFLIKEDCRVNGPKTGTHCTPLYYAVKMNDLEIFKLLWMKGASAFAKDANDDTALELALYENRIKMITLILSNVRLPEKSKNLKCNCKDDVALFHVACWALDFELIQTFISYGFSAKSRSTFGRDDWKGLTPLHLVLSDFFHEKVITILLEHGADFYAKDNQGRTPLHFAFRARGISLFHENIIKEHLTSPHKRRYFNPVDRNGLSLFHIFCTMSFQDEDRAKSVSCIKYFIDNKVDLNSSVSLEDQQFPGYTALLFAAENFSWDLLGLLLESGADPRKSDKNGVTPLHLICRDIETSEEQQRLKIVKLFLQYGADPNAKNSQDRTPLHISFYSHYKARPLTALQKLLLSKNPLGINHTDKNGLSYLHIACTGNNLNIVKTLVTQGALIDSRIHSDSHQYAGYSALHLAVEFNQINLVRFLLAHGADVNCVDKYKATPLHLACDHTYDQFYELGTKSVKKDDNFDWLPSREAHIQMIKLLIGRGALVDAKTSFGRTPLLVNCYIPRNLLMWNLNKSMSESMLKEVVIRQKIVMDILLELGADINACCIHDGGILHIFTSYYSKVPAIKSFLEIALKRGADVNAAGGFKNLTPLHVAVDESMRSGSDTFVIDLFLENGANINAKDGNLNTPLHTALQSYHLNDATLTRLLNHPDVDIDAQNCHNKTPLHLAFDRCDTDSTKKLLSYGADVNVKDINGCSPIYALLERLEQVGVLDEYIQQVFPVVVFHLKILIKLKFYVSDEVGEIFQALLKYLDLDSSTVVDSKIDEELDHLKSKRIDNYTSFYDIIFKDSNAMAKHAKNGDFQDMISSIRDGTCFTIFDDYIERQFNKGLRRREFLEPAISALNSIVQFKWPDCCSEQILSYLSDDNLKNLIESTRSVRKRKRLASDSSSDEEPSAKTSRRNK